MERERKEGEGRENDMKHEIDNRCREKEEEWEFGRGRISCSDGGGNLVLRGGEGGGAPSCWNQTLLASGRKCVGGGGAKGKGGGGVGGGAGEGRGGLGKGMGWGVGWGDLIWKERVVHGDLSASRRFL